MNKFYIIITCLALCLSLFGCGKDKDPVPTLPPAVPFPTAEVTVTPTQTPASTPVPTPVPTPEPTVDPMEKLKLFIEDFAQVYFFGTEEALLSYLSPDAYNDGLYQGEEPGSFTFREPALIENTDNLYFASVQFIAGNEDSYTYLSLEIRETQGEYFITFFGLEK